MIIEITIAATEPWRVEVMDYPHARVRLHFLTVRDWQGDLHMKEGQKMAWQRLPATVWPVLPGTLPVLRWLAEAQGYTGATHTERPLTPPAWLDQVAWDERGLCPAIAQEVGTNDVLMVAWMNREALLETWARGQAVYWSRSRQRLWHKGEESGHVQTVHDVRLDCDQDVILLKVTQQHGVACHTGRHSCFFLQLDGEAWNPVEPVLVELFDVFRSAQLGEGRKSLAFRLRFQQLDRTLTDAEVADARAAIVAAAEAQHAATLRA